MIDGGAHHLDLRYNSEFDPESVIKTRALEVRYFKQWIKQAATTQWYVIKVIEMKQRQ